MLARTPRALATGLAALAGLLLTACGSDGTAASSEAAPYTEVAAPTLEPGDAVPAPVEDVVLTISGDISTTNVGDTLQLDLPTLERLGLVEYSVDDQQAEGRVAMFRGPLMSTLLKVAGAGDGATTLRSRALNDYEVDIPISDVERYPVLLATSVDGERMPVDSYGPIRVIYPYESFDIDPVVHDPLWIWQLASIDVR